MYVIVGGAGEVGYHVARALREENHDVAVIETDPHRLERLQDLDVLTIQGNLASKRLLEGEAKVKDAELLIACTGDDEVNMVAAALAKTHGCRTIARLNQTDYLDVPYSDEYQRMGIDVAVSPEMVAAIRIRRLLNQPRLTSTDLFLNGKVIVAEGRVTPDAFVVGKRIGDIEPPEGFNLFAVYRGDDVIIPRGDLQFHVNDRLLMALTSVEILKDVEAYIGRAKEVSDPGTEIRRIMIAGATRVGIHLARLLERSKRDVVLVEPDATAARYAGEQLGKTLVVHGDATDRALLIQENVDTFDAFVGATKTEEYNVLTALMAKQLGVDMTVAVIHQPELKSFLESLHIDLAVAPRLSTVGAILKHVHPTADDLELQGLGEERVMTFRVQDDSTVSGKRISKIRFPRHSILAAVVRGDQVILPRGQHTLETGDQVLAYCLSDAVEPLERLFK